MIYNFLSEYLSIVIFLVHCFIFKYVALCIAQFYLASPSNPDPEKLSAYECGFEPFDDSRMEFDVRFYLVAILFIIFDLRNSFFISMGNFIRRNIGMLLVFTSMMIFSRSSYLQLVLFMNGKKGL